MRIQIIAGIEFSDIRIAVTGVEDSLTAVALIAK